MCLLLDTQGLVVGEMLITGQPQRLDRTAISQAPPIVGSQVPEAQMEDEEDLDDDRVDEPTPVQLRRRVKFVDSTGKERIIGKTERRHWLGTSVI